MLGRTRTKRSEGSFGTCLDGRLPPRLHPHDVPPPRPAGFTLPVLAAVAAAGGVIFANQVASVAAATDNKLVDTIPMIDMSAYLDRENR